MSSDPALPVAQVGRCVVKKEGDYKREDDLRLCTHSHDLGELLKGSFSQ